ncbi:hypothetical protein N9L92_00255 [Saprospiraceae bacterium]|nr:hypothetical protein [Saprospiraceae bacterium]
MKFHFPKLFIIFSIVSFISCSPEKSEKLIDMTMSPSHQHVGYGYYMNLPDMYEKANSYNGYQVKGYESSISIEDRYDSFEDLIKIYHKNNFRSSDLDLVETRPITGPDGFKGLLVVMKNNRQQRMDIRLFFEDNDKTFEVKAYYLNPLTKKYKTIIRDAILSIARGQEEVQEEEFKLASLVSFSEVVYTRDGKYPTEEPDGLTIEEKRFEEFKNIKIHYLIDKSKKEIAKDAEDGFISGEELGNGTMYYSRLEANGKVGMVMFITNEKTGEGLLVKCYGNYRLNYDIINDILDKRYFTISIDRN